MTKKPARSEPVTDEWIANKMKDYQRCMDVVEFDMQQYTIENVGYAIVKALEATGDTFAMVAGLCATRDVLTVIIEYHKLKQP